jgi:hypothetical protein
MNQSEKHNFEDEWKQFFESASETPPPSVWDGITEQLDKKATPIVPLVWWKNPRTLYTAAAVVALLLLSWPIMKLRSPESQKDRITQTPQSTEPKASTDPGLIEGNASERIAQATSPAQPSSTNTGNASTTNQLTILPGITLPAQPISRLNSGINPTQDIDSHQPVSADAPALSEKLSGEETPSIVTLAKQHVTPNSSTSGQELPPVLAEKNTSGLTLAALTPLGTSEQSVYFQKRYVFYKPDVTEQVTPEPTRNTEYWAGIGVMPSSFNPQINVTSPPAAFSQANASRQSMSNSSKAGLSYALQMQTGVKVSKHWSIETGLSYLQGNSTFISDGYVLDAVTSRSANVLENALLSGGQQKNNADFTASAGFGPDPNKIAAFYIDLDQSTNNDYRYLQLPVQAGYTLNPDGKVSYTVLGGMVANLFLKNELQSASGYRFTTTPQDGLYRTLNWSAATGVRFNYHISEHFSASLTGAYQKALSSSLHNNSDVESRPQLYGLTWGVRYDF